MIGLRRAGALALLTLCPGALPAEEVGFIQRTIRGFEESDFEFQRAISNVPFPPIAFASATAYGDVEVELSDGTVTEYDVDRASLMGAVPMLLSKRDALVVGGYLSRSSFSFEDERVGNFDVDSVGLPVGWIRQQHPDWQVAAFAMPLGHQSELGESDWSWQYLGGAFARYIQTDHLWWAFGLYADIGAGDDFYIPYLGASWSINERWTISAVMPWPSVIYAPSPNWLLRFGMTPSGASWRVDDGSGDVGVDFNAWDFGLSGEVRLAGNLWLSGRVGFSGLQGIVIEGSSLDEPETDLDNAGYVGVSLNVRPGIRP